MKEHPFPPVVRWALFPALAAAFGAAGGVWGGIGGPTGVVEFIAVVGAIGVGAAAASMVSVRVWPSLVLAPLLGLFTLCAVVAGVEAARKGVAPHPWDILRSLQDKPDALFLISGIPFLQTLAHRASMGRAWPLALAAGLGCGLTAFAVAWMLVPETGDKLRGSALLGLSTLAQAPAMLAATAIARRLRPPEAA